MAKGRRADKRQRHLFEGGGHAPRYEIRQCAVVWIDVLGFRDLIKAVENGHRYAQSRLRVLEHLFVTRQFRPFFRGRV
jgi:hypothetical protein